MCVGSPTRNLGAGDLLFFYLSKMHGLARSQSVTTLAIIEQTQLATSANDLTRMVGRRSVYSQESLTKWAPTDVAPVLVIDFLLCGHFEPHRKPRQPGEAGVFRPATDVDHYALYRPSIHRRCVLSRAAVAMYRGDSS